MPFTPTTQSAASPIIAQAYQKKGALTPQSCKDVSAKIRNIQRLIESVEEVYQQQTSLNQRMNMLNKGLLITTVVRDTCKAFLNLAADLLPEGPAEKVASLGPALIDTAQSGAEIYHGQANLGEVAQRTASTLQSQMPGKTPAQQVWKAKAGQVTNATGLVQATNGADAATRKREAEKFAVNTVVDQAKMIVDLAGDTPGLKKVSSGFGVFKSAANYSYDLDAAQDAYFDEHLRLMESKYTSQVNHTHQIKKLQTMLSEALAEFEACAAM